MTTTPEPQTVYRVGTIAGRHPLPVDVYLFTDPLPATGHAAFLAAVQAAQDYAARFDGQRPYGERGPEVELYYTGLTEVTLGALHGFASHGIGVYPMAYDAVAGTYNALYRPYYCTCGRALAVTGNYCSFCGHS